MPPLLQCSKVGSQWQLDLIIFCVNKSFKVPDDNNNNHSLARISSLSRSHIGHRVLKPIVCNSCVTSTYNSKENCGSGSVYLPVIHH